MTKKGTPIAIVAVLIVVGAVVAVLWPRPADVPRPNGCGAPPDAIIASKVDVNVVLLKSMAVLKGQQDTTIVDVIPPNARTSQVISYVLCVAKEKQIFNTSEEYQAHADLMAFLATGPSPEQFLKFQQEKLRKPYVGLPYQTENFLKSLRVHFEKNVAADEFQLSLDSARLNELDRFWVGELGANSWAELFTKICRKHEACLKCTPPPGQIVKTVKIEISGPVMEDKTPEGAKRFSCAARSGTGKTG